MVKNQPLTTCSVYHIPDVVLSLYCLVRLDNIVIVLNLLYLYCFELAFVLLGRYATAYEKREATRKT